MSQNETWTIAALRKWTADYFRKAGIDSPQLDADLLLSSILGVERIQLLINGDQEVDADSRARFRTAVIRRAKNRDPIAYILGHREFWSLDFIVSPDTLIPRPDTECLVEAVLSTLPQLEAPDVSPRGNEITAETLPDSMRENILQMWEFQDAAAATEEASTKRAAIPLMDENGRLLKTRDIYADVDAPTEETATPAPDTSAPASAQATQRPSLRIVDIGTGTGAIAVALATELKNRADITAVDISERALDIARLNAQNNGCEIQFFQSDLLQKVAGPFDIVVSNPPYITDSEYAALAPEVHREPRLALTAGMDGLDIYKRLIPQAFSALRTGGLLAVEIGASQAGSVTDLFAKNGFRNIETRRDYAGKPRIILGWKAD